MVEAKLKTLALFPKAELLSMAEKELYQFLWNSDFKEVIETSKLPKYPNVFDFNVK